MTPDLTSVISSSDLLKYLILIKTIDTHLLLSGRTFISQSVYKKSWVSPKTQLQVYTLKRIIS